MRKRAVWIFDDNYKTPTYLSVASFRNEVNIPVTLLFTGAELSVEVLTAFNAIGNAIEIIHHPINKGNSRRELHIANRLTRMEVMKRWPDELVFMLDGDLMFNTGTDWLINEVEAACEKNGQASFIAGVEEYDRHFYTEKKSQFGKGIHTSKEVLEECLTDVFGYDFEKQLSGKQFNNGVLVVYQCQVLSHFWQLHYENGLKHTEVNPEDDQLPLAVALYNLTIPTHSLPLTYNALGRVDGDYTVYHAWNGKWKKELQKLVQEDYPEKGYAALARKYIDQIPWQIEELNNEKVALK